MPEPSFLRRAPSALFLALLMAGCIKVANGSGGGDDGGCDDDRDCERGEICNGGECESPGAGGTGGSGGTGAGGSAVGGTGTSGSGGACSWYCDLAAVCGDTTVAECLPDCQALYATGGACSAAFDSLASCILPYANDCAAAEQNCAARANAVVGACSGDTCPYTDDGECDEPDICPEGTDVNDCVCPYTDDGECDEPEGLNLCPEGSDANDCECRNSPGNDCTFACDRECDEATGTNLCPAGSDQWDCARYP